MELKILVKNTSYLTITRLFQFVAGLVYSKVYAMQLGTTGTGLMNQLTILTQKMNQITTLSMNDGVVKIIAGSKEQRNLKEIIKSILKTYSVLLIFTLLISIALLYIFSDKLTAYLFGGNEYSMFFLTALLTYPFMVIESIPFAILKAFKGVKYISRARIYSVILNLIIFLPLLYFLNLRGAVIFILLSHIISLIIHYILARKYYLVKLNIKIKEIFRSPFDIKYFKELFVFAGFGLTTGIVLIFSDLFCRAVVVKYLGVDKIGIYSPIITWAGVFTGFILPSMSTYLYPRFCEAKSNSEINALLNDIIRLVTFLMFPLIVFGIPLRSIVIPLFYSKGFLEASLYLPYHFTGTVFYVWWYALGLVLTPIGKIRLHGLLLILFSIIDMLVAYFFVPKYGLYGWMLKFMITPILSFTIYYIYLNRRLKFKFNKDNLILTGYMLVTIILLLGINLISNNNTIIQNATGIILACLIFFVLKHNEIAFIKNKLSYVKIFKK